VITIKILITPLLLMFSITVSGSVDFIIIDNDLFITCCTDNEYIRVLSRDDDTRQPEAESPAPGICIGSVMPNPSASAIIVPFTLDRSSFVTLGLFDTSSRAVYLVADGFYQTGNHTASFNTVDVAGGVYLLRLEALGRSVSETCVVLK
jgi:hypothetical protein